MNIVKKLRGTTVASALALAVVNPFNYALAVDVTYQALEPQPTVFDANDVFKPAQFAQQMGDGIRFGKNPKQISGNAQQRKSYTDFKQAMTDILTDLMDYSPSFAQAMFDLSHGAENQPGNRVINGADFSSPGGDVVWNDDTMVLLVTKQYNRGYLPTGSDGISANVFAYEGGQRVQRGVRAGVELGATTGAPAPSVVVIDPAILKGYSDKIAAVKAFVAQPNPDWAAARNNRSTRTSFEKVNRAYQAVSHEFSHSASYATGTAFPVEPLVGSPAAIPERANLDEHENVWNAGPRPINERIVMEEMQVTMSSLFSISYQYGGFTAAQMVEQFRVLQPAGTLTSPAQLLTTWDQSVNTYYRNFVIPPATPPAEQDQWIADARRIHSTCPFAP
ncbi:MAG: hypothetical protein Tsb002_24050 [Wenzhouxiangellaceae bacterium]